MARVQYSDVVIDVYGKPIPFAPVTVVAVAGSTGTNVLYEGETGEATLPSLATDARGFFKVWLTEGRYDITAGMETKRVDLPSQGAAAVEVEAEKNRAEGVEGKKADLEGGYLAASQVPPSVVNGSVVYKALAGEPGLLISGAVTRSANGAALKAPVVWPDGATGTYEGTESATVPGAIDSYTITHVEGETTHTYTQAKVTRNSSGAVTNRPAITYA